MLKAVLDTNVIISAFLTDSGIPQQLFRSASDGDFINVTSQFILDEVDRILRDKFAVEGQIIREMISRIVTFSDTVFPQSIPNVITADPSDNEVLAAALESGSQYVISGDKHLKTLGRFQDIKMVTPVKFRNILDEDLG